MTTKTKDVPVKTVQKQPETEHPITNLRQEIDNLFENFMTGFPVFPRWSTPFMNFPEPRFALSPDVDFSETDEGYEITAEIPGLDAKDLDITLTNDVLTLKGEKKHEREEKNKGYYLNERSYGAFQRTFRLPDDVDGEHIATHYDKGVLRINLPRSPEARAKTRKIEVK